LKRRAPCYAAERTAPVTVEAVVQAAGIATGTFYLHFQDLAALEAEVGEALLIELGERLEPTRLLVHDPLTRRATALTILLRDLAAEPAQARLAAHAIVAIPEVRRRCRPACART
jgi:AcrR family transcriptional regulator